MKNHDIHENKNVCPEFNGEKMHEHSVFLKTSFWQTLSLENHQKEADNSYAVKVVPSIPQKFLKIGEIMPKIFFWRNFWASQEEGNETKEFQGRQVRKDEAPKMR